MSEAVELLAHGVKNEDGRREHNNFEQIDQRQGFRLEDLLEGRKVDYEQLPNDGTSDGPKERRIGEEVEFIKAKFGGSAGICIE